VRSNPETLNTPPPRPHPPRPATFTLTTIHLEFRTIPSDPHPKEDITTPPSPDQLTKPLERSQAQIAAGDTRPLEPFVNELRASIARMKVKRAARAPGKRPQA